LRKLDPSKAELVSKQILDRILINAQIPHDIQSSAKRNLSIVDDFLRMKV